MVAGQVWSEDWYFYKKFTAMEIMSAVGGYGHATDKKEVLYEAYIILL